MARLSLFLPSFAADYSGVCSCLFDLDALVVVADAACCTRNYIDYDEPRWSRGKTTTLCAQLRTLDVVMGDEAKTVAKVAAAARELEPRMVALLGSPVPAITGMDFRGMAHDIEDATGVPALGFATTGFATYERGLDLAHRELAERFGPAGNGMLRGAGDGRPALAPPARPTADGRPEGTGPCGLAASPERPAVNVLGLTPLDFGGGPNAEDLRECLDGAGLAVNAAWCMGLSLEGVAQVGKASVNLVVSAGALGVARALERAYGTPYVVGMSLAGAQAGLVCEALRRAARGGASSYAFAGGPHAESCDAGVLPESSRTVFDARMDASGAGGEAVLVVGDWVCAASVRSALRLSGWSGPVTVASLFGQRPGFAEPGDVALAGDADLAALVARGGFSVVVGDPLLARIPGVPGARHVRTAHPAVSSNLFAKEVPRYFVDDIVRRL